MLNAYDAKYRPEMHSVERGLVLEQLDSAWKTHLLSMDNLRSGVGLRGYAQEDPKIVYKREGMKEFDGMWDGVRDRVTEAVFRMEEMGDEEAQMALWAGARATQEAAISIGAIAGRPGRRRLAIDQRRRRGEEGRADPQPRRQGRPQRPMPLRYREEIQELPHEAGSAEVAAEARSS